MDMEDEVVVEEEDEEEEEEEEEVDQKRNWTTSELQMEQKIDFAL